MSRATKRTWLAKEITIAPSRSSDELWCQSERDQFSVMGL
jgi:hypothetical protein